VVEIGIKFNYWADPVFYPFGICNSRVDDEGRRTFSLKAHTKVVYHAKAVEATSDQGLGSIEVGKQIEYPPHKIIALFNGQFIENVEDARKYVASTLGDNLS
jgi:hypothetical protein